MSRSFAFLPAVLFCMACSSGSKTSPGAPADTGPVDANNGGIVCSQLSKDPSACGATIVQCTIPDDARTHVPQGTTVVYPTNPPCGGHHYPVWIEWGVHPTPISTGNWVHNLEHGGVALLYRCASHDACPDVASKLEAIAAAVPADPECVAEGGTVHARVLVLPDPDLPSNVQVAAAAWGFSLTMPCMDGSSEATLRKFYDDHIGNGPEDLCAQGASDPGGGGVTMDSGTTSETGDARDAD